MRFFIEKVGLNLLYMERKTVGKLWKIMCKKPVEVCGKIIEQLGEFLGTQCGPWFPKSQFD